MNELQIKITADLKDLQSALNKAKASLKSFESETAKDKAKSNAEQERTIGLIEEQIQKAKQLKVALSQATNEQDIAAFNAELEQTNQELARLNALGKSFANTSVQSFNKFRVSAGAANGSAIVFNRVIQDAPFGIIGVGNNIQQLAEQFSALRVTTGSTGSALSTFFKSLFTGSNLLVLGISAATAAFTAYQLGAFDSAEETRDLDQELSDFTKTLDSVTKAQLEANQTAIKEIEAFKLLQKQAEAVGLSDEKRLAAVKQIKKEWPDYLKGLSDEEILAGKVGDAYIKLTEGIKAGATARVFSQKIAENDLKIEELKFLQQEKGLKVAQKIREQEKARREDEQRRSMGTAAGGFGSAAISEAASIESEIVDLLGEIKVSESDINKIKAQNVILDSKITANIVKAGGLLDDEKDKRDDITQTAKELNAEQMFAFDRELKAQKDRELAEQKAVQYSGQILEDYEKLQATLLNTLAQLKQNPAFGLNPVFIAAIESKLKSIDGIVGSIASKRAENILPEIDASKLTGLESGGKLAPGLVQDYEQQIAKIQELIKITSDPEALARYQEQLKTAQNALSALLDNSKLQVEDLAQAFTGLGSVIGRAFNNPQLGTFLGTFLTFASKLVAANFKIAGSNAVAGASQAAAATGPAAPITLPAFIAGALGVVAAAFAAFGNFGSSSSSSMSSGQGSTFTNRREFGGPVSKGRAYIVGERRPELFVPNTNGVIVPQVPSMDYSGTSMSAGAMAIDVNIQGVSYGDDILFTVQQAQIRRGIR
jgi:hypothetical protein